MMTIKLPDAASIKNRLADLCCRVLAWLSLSSLRKLAATLAAIQWLCKSSARQTVENNLALCFPQLPKSERQHLAWRSLKQNAQTLLELPWVWSYPFHNSAPLIQQVLGEELFDAALADSRGLLLLLPHLGNWEVVNHYLVHKTPLTALYKPAKLPALEQRMQQARNQAGTKMLPTNLAGVKAVFKVLREGGVSVILPDQAPPPPAGEFAAFFGVPAYTGVLTAKLVKQTQCQCLTMVGRRVENKSIFANRQQSAGFEIVFRKVDAQVFAEDLHTVIAGINSSVETCVREAVDQYQWSYKRFKYQPT